MERPAPELPRLAVGAPIPSEIHSDEGLLGVEGGTIVFTHGTGTGIAAVDLTTGETLWDRDSGGDFGPLGGNIRVHSSTASTAELAFVDYTIYGCDLATCEAADAEDASAAVGVGIGAVRAKEGTPMWGATLVQPAPLRDPLYDVASSMHVSRAAEIDGVLLVTVELDDHWSKQIPEGQARIVTIGLDSADGTELWRAEGFDLDDSAVDIGWGSLHADPAAKESERAPARIDPMTGDMLWTGDPGEDLVGGGSTGALIEVEEDTRNIFVDLDGTPVPGGEIPGEVSCAEGPGPLTCVSSTEKRLRTLQGSDEVLVSAPTEFDRLHISDGEYLWADDAEAQGLITATVAIDRQGNRLSDPIEGEILARTPDRILLQPYGTEAGPDLLHPIGPT